VNTKCEQYKPAWPDSLTHRPSAGEETTPLHLRQALHLSRRQRESRRLYVRPHMVYTQRNWSLTYLTEELNLPCMRSMLCIRQETRMTTASKLTEKAIDLTLSLNVPADDSKLVLNVPVADLKLVLNVPADDSKLVLKVATC